MTNRWAYDQPPQTADEYKEAIAEAEAQVKGLNQQVKDLEAEALRWKDRARTLQIEYYFKFEFPKKAQLS